MSRRFTERDYATIDLYLGDSAYEKAVVTSTSGDTIELTDAADIVDMLNKYARYLRVDLPTLFADKSTYHIVEHAKVASRGRSSKKSKVVKKVLQITGITAALVLIGCLAESCNRKKSSEFVTATLDDNKEMADDSGSQEMDASVSEENYQGDTFNLEDGIIKVAPETHEKPEDYNESFLTNLKDESRYSRLPEIVKKLLYKENVSEDEFQYFMDSVALLCQSNVAEVEKLVEGKRMGGDEVELYLYRMFPEKSFDYAALYEFFMSRNNVFHTAYENNSEVTKAEVSAYLHYFMDFVFNGEGVYYNGEYWGFYELSPVARFLLVSLGQSVLEIDHSFTHQVNGVECDYDMLINEMAEFFNTVTNNCEVNLH